MLENVMNTEELKKYALAAKLRPDLQVEQVVYRAAANPTAILALIEQHDAVNSELLATRDDNHSMMLEIEGLRKARDELLAALREIAAWVERYTASGHPVSVVARAAIAKAEG